MFALCEVETALYARFVALCEKYELVTQNLLYVPKAATRIHTGQEDEDSAEDEEDDEEEEEDAEDGDEGEDDEAAGRGRDKDDRENENKRTRSLDRDRPAKNVDIPSSRLPPAQPSVSSPSKPFDTTPGSSSNGPSGAEAMIPLSFASPHSVESSVSQKVQQIEEHQAHSEPEGMFNPPRGGTISRGTTGRGKQPRGTMLWSSDNTTPPLPTQAPTIDPGPGAELSRTESVETAIHVGDADPQENNGGSAAAPIDVPKDEIDLLEDEGKLPPAPLVDADGSTSTAADASPENAASTGTPAQESASADAVDGITAEVKDLSVADADDPAEAKLDADPEPSSDGAKMDSSTSPEPDTGANMQTIGPNRKGNRKRGKGR